MSPSHVVLHIRPPENALPSDIGRSLSGIANNINGYIDTDTHGAYALADDGTYTVHLVTPFTHNEIHHTAIRHCRQNDFTIDRQSTAPGHGAVPGL